MANARGLAFTLFTALLMASSFFMDCSWSLAITNGGSKMTFYFWSCKWLVCLLRDWKSYFQKSKLLDLSSTMHEHGPWVHLFKLSVPSQISYLVITFQPSLFFFPGIKLLECFWIWHSFSYYRDISFLHITNALFVSFQHYFLFFCSKFQILTYSPSMTLMLLFKMWLDWRTHKIITSLVGFLQLSLIIFALHNL